MQDFSWQFPAPDETHPGDRVGPYRVLEVLGSGGVGVVLKVQDALGRDLALKLLLASKPDAETIERFRREGVSTAALRHPGIVTIHDLGVCDRGPYLVYEYVSGRNLAERFEELDREALLDVVLQVSRALAHAHERGVVHRDLKPANILVTPEGRALVADFGLALRAQDERLTRTGDLVGTPFAMAPEQITGLPGDCGPATDVWALGGLLYRALTGRECFEAQTISELAVQIISVDPPDPRSLDSTVDPALVDVCLKALSKSPAARHPDAGEFADELEAALRADPSSTSSARWPVLLLAGLALSAVAATLLLPSSAPETPPSRAPATDRREAPPPISIPESPPQSPRHHLSLYELTTDLLLPDDQTLRVRESRLLIAQETASKGEARVVLNGEVLRFRGGIRFFDSNLAYDSWNRQPDEATFLGLIEGARITTTLDPRTGRVLDVSGVNALRRNTILPAAKAWRSSEAARSKSNSLMALNDEALRRGLTEVFSNASFTRIFALLLGVLPPPVLEATSRSIDAETRPPLVWPALPITLEVRRVRAGTCAIEGRARGRRESIRVYSMTGTATRDDAATRVVLRERYVLVFPREFAHMLLRDNFGIFDFRGTVIRLERTLRYSSPPDERPR